MDQSIIHFQTTNCCAAGPLEALDPKSLLTVLDTARCLRLLIINPEQRLPLGQLLLPASERQLNSSADNPAKANSHFSSTQPSQASSTMKLKFWLLIWSWSDSELGDKVLLQWGKSRVRRRKQVTRDSSSQLDKIQPSPFNKAFSIHQFRGVPSVPSNSHSSTFCWAIRLRDCRTESLACGSTVRERCQYNNHKPGAYFPKQFYNMTQILSSPLLSPLSSPILSPVLSHVRWSNPHQSPTYSKVREEATDVQFDGATFPERAHLGLRIPQQKQFLNLNSTRHDPT